MGAGPMSPCIELQRSPLGRKGCFEYTVYRMRLSMRRRWIRMMPRSKVTAKYQVTIPKEVRERTGVEPGETVSVEAISKAEIRLRRFPGVRDPLKVLVGLGAPRRRVPIAELEERAESR